MILSKVLSARFIVTVLLVATYCFCVAAKIELDTAFTAIVTTVIYAYFNRSDRNKGGAQ